MECLGGKYTSMAEERSNTVCTYFSGLNEGGSELFHVGDMSQISIINCVNRLDSVHLSKTLHCFLSFPKIRQSTFSDSANNKIVL